MDRRTRLFLAVGLVAAILVAGVVSLVASDQPDGLERVSIDQGFDDTAGDPAIGSPLADYEVDGVGDGGLSRGLAGVIGVIVTLALTVGLLQLVRRRRPNPDGDG